MCSVACCFRHIQSCDNCLTQQVPFESLKRAAKDRKNSLDEVTSIVKMLETQSTASMTTAEQLEVLNKMALRLQSLKRKVQFMPLCIYSMLNTTL